MMHRCLLQLLWNYKLNLTTDPKFESVATEVCKSTIAEVSLPCPCTPARLHVPARACR